MSNPAAEVPLMVMDTMVIIIASSIIRMIFGFWLMVFNFTLITSKDVDLLTQGNGTATGDIILNNPNLFVGVFIYAFVWDICYCCFKGIRSGVSKS